MNGNWTWNPAQWDAIVNIASHEKMHRTFSRNLNLPHRHHHKTKADKYAKAMRKVAQKAEISAFRPLLYPL